MAEIKLHLNETFCVYGKHSLAYVVLLGGYRYIVTLYPFAAKNMCAAVETC